MILTMYTTSDLREFFAVSRQTVSNWCKEFARYLSPTATPPDSSHRRFTDDDLRVLSLVAEMMGQGKKFEEVHSALRAGQLGDIPLAPEQALTSDFDRQRQLFLARVSELELKLDKLRTERDEAVGQAKLLREQFETITAEVRSLYREIGKLESQVQRKPVD